MVQRSPARRRDWRPRRGMALVLCMFFICIVTLMAFNVFDSITVETSALRNSLDYERALYLSNAGVHHAAAMLEATPTWTGVVSDGAYPANDTYQATAVAGSNNTVVVTSKGVSGGVTRTVVATLEP